MLRQTFPALLAVIIVVGTGMCAGTSRPVSAATYTSTAFESRVQQRLQRRLRVIEREQPDEYARIRMMLQRREERRSVRLQASVAPAVPPLKREVVDAVNMQRALRSIPALRYQSDLETAAQRHAQDMKDRDFFSHENPEGLRSGDRIKQTGYGNVNAQECRCNYKVFLGENIAKGQTTIDQVIAEWMASDSHREAMLSRDYTEIGVGIIDDIWVLNFGSIKINPR